MLRKTLVGLGLALLLSAGAAPAHAQGTAFTYQGELKNSGTPVSGTADFEFRLFDAFEGGTQTGPTLTPTNVDVTNGVFSLPLDFGTDPYTLAEGLYLEISVRSPAGVGPFTTFGTRQALTPTPFSLATRGINVTSSNNVGIGTPSPNSLFHVVGNGFNTFSSVPYGIFETFADSSSSNQFGPQLRLKHGGPGGQEWVMVSSGSGNGPAGAFQLVRQGASSAAFATDTDGWVGIGTSSPITGLGSEVLGVANRPGNTGYNGMILDSASGTGLPYYGYSHGGQLRGWTTVNDSGQMEFWNNGELNITISPTGNVGLGTNPQARLHNPGTTRLDGQLRFGDQTWNGSAGTNANLTRFASNTFSNVVLDLSSTATSTFIIQQNGQDRIHLANTGFAGKPGGGSWAVLSDERTKNDIQPMTGTLDRLLQLKGHAYTYKPEFVQSGVALPGTQIGLVAQEVEAVFPDWVTTGQDGLKQVTERSTTALMVEALRDLRAEKDAEINALKARLEKLEALLEAQAAK